MSVQNKIHKSVPNNDKVWNAAVDKIITELSPEVTSEEKVKLTAVLRKYKNVFSIDDSDLGCTNIIEHSITTTDDLPVRQELRRQPNAYQSAIDEHTDVLLKQGIIEPSMSDFPQMLCMLRKRTENQDAVWTIGP